VELQGIVTDRQGGIRRILKNERPEHTGGGFEKVGQQSGLKGNTVERTTDF
jgi:hypothetical protein